LEGWIFGEITELTRWVFGEITELTRWVFGEIAELTRWIFGEIRDVTRWIFGVIRDCRICSFVEIDTSRRLNSLRSPAHSTKLVLRGGRGWKKAAAFSLDTP